MWHSLKQNLQSVKHEIADCQSMDGWEGHCQLMLKATFGINYYEFFEFIKYICKKRIGLINNSDAVIEFSGWHLGFGHAIFDLIKIKEIISELCLDNDFKLLGYFQESFLDVKSLIDEINMAVQQI